MPFTADDLARINQAIATGESRVQYADRSVQYRTVDELLKARDRIAAEIAANENPGGFRRVRRLRSTGFDQ